MDWLDIKEFFRDTFQYFLTFVFVLIIAIYVTSFNQIVGPSMTPTLNEGDITILFKLQYKFFSVERGDIISLKTGGERNFVKRVVGLPGEIVVYDSNKLYIDGDEINEKYLNNDVTTNNFSLKDILNADNESYPVIPKDMYLVLGDNRNNSVDSRNIGLVKKDEIIGKIVFRIFPFNKIGFIK